MIRVAVLEDTEKDFRLLSGFIQRYSRETGATFEIERFEDGLSFYESGMTCFDIVFMDIEMPLMNGMEAARRMRAQNSESILIFTTNVAQYALQGYEVDAMDYLLKPIGYFNFSLKLRKALGLLERRRQREEKIALTLPKGVQVVPVDTIAYVEVDSHALTYHAERDWTLRSTMKAAEEQLCAHAFQKCNGSCLVNLRKVLAVEENDVVVQTREGPIRLPLSRRLKKDFTQALTRLLTGGGGRS